MKKYIYFPPQALGLPVCVCHGLLFAGGCVLQAVGEVVLWVNFKRAIF